MKHNFAFFTSGELAKIHDLNKRTLHYYDEVGIFSPKMKGKNGYRYYSLEQSIELENILALRELGMSIEEIRTYIQNPNADDFCRLAFTKISEIDKSIASLKKLKTVLRQKAENLLRCKEIYHDKLELVELPEQYLLLTPLPLSFDAHEQLVSKYPDILEHLRVAGSLSNHRRSCGSYISLDKITKHDFKNYDGIYSQVDTKRKNLCIRPGGRYLRGFCVGDWANIPGLYEKMLSFARDRKLTLSGCAFECGLNEFAISSEDEYITQIEIWCQE